MSPLEMPTTLRGLRVAFAGGGTGGHIVPGRHLLAHTRGELGDVLWFVTGRSVEQRSFTGLETTLSGVACERVALALEPDGGGAPSLLGVASRSPRAISVARAALARHHSDVLVGLGGFTCVPAVIAARTLGIPVALLEINSARGRATRWLAAFAQRVFHAWRATLPSGIESPRDLWTGAPLAPDYAHVAPSAEASRALRAALGFDADRPLLAVLGGSQGASALNRFVREHADALLPHVSVLHQVGPQRLDEGAKSREGYRAVEHIDDVHGALCAATIVLCRGGASTLAEVAALRKPALVVPYPHHADRHQERNARELGSGARIVDESRLDAQLAREIAQLAMPSGAAELERMARELDGVVRLDAAQNVWTELVKLGDSRRDTGVSLPRA